MQTGLFALSLANLAMIHVWGVLLYASASDRYYLPSYGARHYAAALVLLAALTAAIAAGSWLVKRIRRPALTALAALTCAAALVAPAEYAREALGITRTETFDFVRGIAPAWRLAAVAVLLSAATIGLRHARLLSRSAFFALLLLSPLALSNAVQAGYHLLSATPRNAGASTPSAPAAAAAAEGADTAPGAPAPGAVRGIWIVFDELDYRLAFPDRPSGLALPELDRLRAESFFATSAREASEHTVRALPSLLLGSEVTSAKPVATDRLSLDLPGEDEPVLTWTDRSFFAQLHARGLRADVVGMYHPYCRLFDGMLRRCHWEPFLPGGGIRTGESLGDALASFAYKLLPLHHRGEHVASIRRSLAASARFAADPTAAVTFIHLPIPHSPNVWDAKRERFAPFRLRGASYVDQLALADRALGEIRRAMERTGTWEGSTVLVTSDHGWRGASRAGEQRDHRVPFLLKLPGPAQPLAHDAPFPAWRAQELLLRALTEELRTPEAVAAWLERRSKETIASIPPAGA